MPACLQEFYRSASAIHIEQACKDKRTREELSLQVLLTTSHHDVKKQRHTHWASGPDAYSYRHRFCGQWDQETATKATDLLLKTGGSNHSTSGKAPPDPSIASRWQGPEWGPRAPGILGVGPALWWSVWLGESNCWAKDSYWRWHDIILWYIMMMIYILIVMMLCWYYYCITDIHNKVTLCCNEIK